MEKLRFNYKSLDELKADLEKYDLELPISDDVSNLQTPVQVGDKTIPNRLSIQPMEGCDALPDGSPGELTFRRYRRFAEGGAGLIWFEATAINEAVRGKPTQLFISRDNLENFKELAEKTREAGIKANGVAPYLVLQITHPGRYGDDKIIAIHEEEIDRRSGVDPEKPVITDAELEALEDDFVVAAQLAHEAGFDAVDVKVCHRYLLNELLGAHARDGKYGGSYENRTRFLKNVIKKIQAANSEIEITTRLNVYDAIALPYGWGCDEDGNIDLTEPKRFVRELVDLGLKMINVTSATPYLTPHLSRPYDQKGKLGYQAPEHPIIGVQQMISLVSAIQAEVPECVIVGTGFSWLRQFAPNVAAGVVESGWATICGFGREAFAYPDFANDVFNKGEMLRTKVCISCSKCSELKGHARLTGCVIRDTEIYLPAHRELMKDLNL